MDKEELLKVASDITTAPNELAKIYSEEANKRKVDIDRAIVEAVGLNPNTPRETLLSIFMEEPKMADMMLEDNATMKLIVAENPKFLTNVIKEYSSRMFISNENSSPLLQEIASSMLDNMVIASALASNPEVNKEILDKLERNIIDNITEVNIPNLQVEVATYIASNPKVSAEYVAFMQDNIENYDMTAAIYVNSAIVKNLHENPRLNQELAEYRQISPDKNAEIREALNSAIPSIQSFINSENNKNGLTISDNYEDESRMILKSYEMGKIKIDTSPGMNIALVKWEKSGEESGFFYNLETQSAFLFSNVTNDNIQVINDNIKNNAPSLNEQNEPASRLNDDFEWASSMGKTAENLVKKFAESGKAEIDEANSTISATGSKYQVVINKENQTTSIYSLEDKSTVAVIDRNTGEAILAAPSDKDIENWNEIKKADNEGGDKSVQRAATLVKESKKGKDIEM